MHLINPHNVVFRVFCGIFLAHSWNFHYSHEEQKNDTTLTVCYSCVTQFYCDAGIEPEGNSVGAPARFIVETFSAGRGDIEVVVLNPRGVQEAVRPSSAQTVTS